LPAEPCGNPAPAWRRAPGLDWVDFAVLTPLTLRGYPRVFAALLVLDAAMLVGTVTEAAHYIDLVAGTGMALFAHVVARRMFRVEDPSLHSVSREDAVQAAFVRRGPCLRPPPTPG
jgi:hypothetical protein